MRSVKMEQFVKPYDEGREGGDGLTKGGADGKGTR